MPLFHTIKIIVLMWWLLFTSTLHAFYNIGVGKADITGPAVGSAMMCYARPEQISSGINDRQWARAFIIAEQDKSSRIAIVVIDAGAIFNSVYREVEERLYKLYGSLYTDQNLLISATHTHSAVAGQSHHFLYNMPSGIFDDLAFERMVSGIVSAVSYAHNHLTDGNISYHYSTLADANINRSEPAYLANPDNSQFPTHTDQLVQQLKFISNERVLGAITWFATHAVSFPNTNKLLSSDNKGYASWLFEQHAKRHWGVDDFVAAFPQSSSGDMSPNIDAVNGKTPPYPEVSVRQIGKRLFEKSLVTFQEDSLPLKGRIASGQRYIDFSNLQIYPDFSGQPHTVHTCSPAMGYSFAAGTEDARTEDFIVRFLGTKEGQLEPGRPLASAIANFLTSPDTTTIECQAPKPVLFDLGSKKNYSLLNSILPPGNLPDEVINYPWVPKVIPIFYAQIGQLQLAGLPVEPTIMAGYRLKSTLQTQTGISANRTIIASYSNDYASYLTTPEEYDQQHYEGGSTLYGRWTLDGFKQELASLASRVTNNIPIKSNKEAQLDLRSLYISTHVKEMYEKEEDHFGWLETDTKADYKSGETPFAVFRSAHPRTGTNLSSLFDVQKKNTATGEWKTVASDDDWTTCFYWIGGYALVEWFPDEYAEPGIYRLVHRGAFLKKSLGNTPSTYEGTSSEFYYGIE